MLGFWLYVGKSHFIFVLIILVLWKLNYFRKNNFSKDWCKKKWDWEKIPYLFRISWKFLSKSWSNCLDGPCGWFSQVMEPFFGLSKPISPTYFLIGSHRNWVWWPTTCLKMLLKIVQNCFNSLYFWWFLEGFVTLGCKEQHLSCTHLSEYGVYY